MTNQNLFLEIEKHLLEDVKPSIFLNKIKEEESFSTNLIMKIKSMNLILGPIH